MELIVVGIIGIVFSASITKKYLRESGLPRSEWKNTAGKVIVPSWVSAINIVAWALIIIGILTFLT